MSTGGLKKGKILDSDFKMGRILDSKLIVKQTSNYPIGGQLKCKVLDSNFKKVGFGIQIWAYITGPYLYGL